MNQPATKECPTGPADPRSVYWIVTHGGIGDLSWVYSKLCSLDLPLFIDVCDESLQQRPRRSGPFLDTLPRVVGWRYVDESFADGGHQWPAVGHPTTCAGKRWADLGVRPGEQFKLECNRVIEGGTPLRQWLPDLPTVYHYPFDRERLQSDYVVPKDTILVHVTGWPGVADSVWLHLLEQAVRLAPTYFMTGSYDKRVGRLMPAIREIPGVRMAVDLPWADAFRLVEQSAYVIGHTSGMMTLANVLSRPGVCNNPASYPGLLGTWADPGFTGQKHVATASAFQRECEALLRSLAGARYPSRPGTSVYAQPQLALGGQADPDRLLLVGDAVVDRAPELVRGLVAARQLPRSVFLVSDSDLTGIRAELAELLPAAHLGCHQLGGDDDGMLLVRLHRARRFSAVLVAAGQPDRPAGLLAQLPRLVDIGGALWRVAADGTVVRSGGGV